MAALAEPRDEDALQRGMQMKVDLVEKYDRLDIGGFPLESTLFILLAPGGTQIDQPGDQGPETIGQIDRVNGCVSVGEDDPPVPDFDPKIISEDLAQ